MGNQATNKYIFDYIYTYIIIFIPKYNTKTTHIYTYTICPAPRDWGWYSRYSRIELRLNWWRPLVLAATTQGAHLMSLLPPLAILCNTNCLASYLVKTLQYQLMPPLSIPSILPQYSPMLSNTGIAILWNITLKYPTIFLGGKKQQYFEISSNNLKYPAMLWNIQQYFETPHLVSTIPPFAPLTFPPWCNLH